MTGGRKFDGIQTFVFGRFRCGSLDVMATLGIYTGRHVGDVNSYISEMAIILRILYNSKFFKYVIFNDAHLNIKILEGFSKRAYIKFLKKGGKKRLL